MNSTIQNNKLGMIIKKEVWESGAIYIEFDSVKTCQTVMKSIRRKAKRDIRKQPKE